MRISKDFAIVAVCLKRGLRLTETKRVPSEITVTQQRRKSMQFRCERSVENWFWQRAHFCLFFREVNIENSQVQSLDKSSLDVLNLCLGT